MRDVQALAKVFAMKRLIEWNGEVWIGGTGKWVHFLTEDLADVAFEEPVVARLPVRVPAIINESIRLPFAFLPTFYSNWSRKIAER